MFRFYILFTTPIIMISQLKMQYDDQIQQAPSKAKSNINPLTSKKNLFNTILRYLLIPTCSLSFCILLLKLHSPILSSANTVTSILSIVSYVVSSIVLFIPAIFDNKAIRIEADRLSNVSFGLLLLMSIFPPGRFFSYISNNNATEIINYLLLVCYLLIYTFIASFIVFCNLQPSIAIIHAFFRSFCPIDGSFNIAI